MGKPSIPEVIEASASVIAFDGGETSSTTRVVPAEVPVNLVYGGIPFAVMMATPRDLDDFAVGFSLTEGIIESPRDIRGIRVRTEPQGLLVEIDLKAEKFRKHLARKRALAGRTGCGVCGIEDLKALSQAKPPAGAAPCIAAAAIRSALTGLEGAQPLNERSRALHAAAWADWDGTIKQVREDVGRHNALDKLIGALCREGTDPGQGFVIVTSRCSYELVEKLAAFGARSLIAISAPTSLAIEWARHHDITLVGIARRDSMTVFHGLERILVTGDPQV